MKYDNWEQIVNDAAAEMLRRFLDAGNCLAGSPADHGHAVGKQVKAAYGSYWLEKTGHKPNEHDAKHINMTAKSITAVAKIEADKRWQAMNVLLGV